MYRLALIALVVAGLAGSFFTVESLAVFTDTTSNENNLFATGQVQIDSAPAAAMFEVNNMAPGDTEDGQLTISNGGTLELRYAMTADVTDPDGLATQLELTIRDEGDGCGVFNGNVLYDSILLNAAFGDPAQGAQAGDRTLGAGTGEVLCFRVHLPLGTDNTYQDTSASATFTFHAEQTANNP